jgi:hypothetical protein
LLRVYVYSSERYIIIIETIHRILLILTDDADVNSRYVTKHVLLEQLGQSSQLLTSMIDSTWNQHDNRLDLVRTRFV